MMIKEYSDLTLEEKRVDLFLRQKHTLDLFLERNTISKAQYDKSLGDLIEKMGIKDTAVSRLSEDKQ
jgi:DNA-binding MarR family transcriptional regulator